MLAAALLWWQKSHPSATPRTRAPAQVSPLAAVPQGATLIATLDAKKLRSTPLGSALLTEGGDLPGLGPIVDICGFDPTLSVAVVTFALPSAAPDADEDDEAPVEFGIAAYGDFSADRVAACASTAITHRGGSPVATKVGSFISIRQRQGSDGEIAARDNGPVLLGAGRYLREMIDAADGRVPNAQRDEQHRRLRASLGEDGTLLVTWLLPRGWLENLAENSLARLSPLSAVDRAALRVDIGTRSLVTLALGCESPTACSDLAEIAKSLIESELEPLLTDQFPSAVQRFGVVAASGQVRVTLWLHETEAIQLASRMLEKLRAQR
jgi:hypothetical protein